MKCSECGHRAWEEGDRSETPPGYGVHFCDLTPPPAALPKAVAYGEEDPANCPLAKTPNAALTGAEGVRVEVTVMRNDERKAK